MHLNQVLEAIVLHVNKNEPIDALSDWFDEQDLGPFVIIQKGVYRHSMFGIFSKLHEAVKKAFEECKKEDDSYHDIQIVMFHGMNNRINQVILVVHFESGDVHKFKQGGGTQYAEYKAAGKYSIEVAKHANVEEIGPDD